MAQYPQEIIDAAKQMYLRRWTMTEIKNVLGMTSPRVLYMWRDKGHWDDLLKDEQEREAVARRLVLLAARDNKSPADLKEMAALTDILLKLEKVELLRTERELIKSGAESLAAKGNNSSSASSSASSNKASNNSRRRSSKGKKDKAVKNDISALTQEDFDKVADKLFFGYQKLWRATKADNKLNRRRFILKSRQIGATFYFAWEAFEDAVINGDNQIFISASKDQAEIFKAYIIAIAREYFDIDLSGAIIVLSNGAELRFVSTNSRTAQGYHGHVYFDEVFWVPDWKKLEKVASAMAMQKKYRKTYFSTPSIITHQAYPLWSGEQYNEGRKDKDQVKFDLSHAALKDGQLGPDGIWRHMVTIEDAEQQGCNLFDIAEVREEFSKSDFANLCMCRFVDDSNSVFPLSDLLACAVDRSTWQDFDPKARRPLGDKPVWVGYDPSRTRDNASVVVVAPPDHEYPLFRVLEVLTYQGKNFTWQAGQIKKLVDDRYNVKFMGVDTTGIGAGVYEMIKAYYPAVKAIFYSLATKTELVLKGIDLVENHRLQYDAGLVDFPRSFLTIKKTTTGNGQVTYAAGRTQATGHADMAWALLHAVSKEKLNPRRKKSSVGLSV